MGEAETLLTAKFAKIIRKALANLSRHAASVVSVAYQKLLKSL